MEVSEVTKKRGGRSADKIEGGIGKIEKPINTTKSDECLKQKMKGKSKKKKKRNVEEEDTEK